MWGCEMIDEARTLELFGYTSDELSPASVCKECARANGDICKELCVNGGCLFRSSGRKLHAKKLLDERATEREKRGGRVSLSTRMRVSAMSTQKKDSADDDYINDEKKRRKTLTEEARQKISDTHKGKIVSDESRQRQSATRQGISYDEWCGYVDNDWRDWRNTYMLNEPFHGSHRHHITEDIAVHIPAKLHNHEYHNLKSGVGMEKMNDLAIQYLLKNETGHEIVTPSPQKRITDFLH